MGWLIALAVLILLAILPMGGRVTYTAEGLQVWIVAGALRFRIYPRKKKPKQASEKKKPKQKKSAPKEKKPEEKTGGDWKEFLPLVRVGLDFLGDLWRKLRVDILEMQLNVAEGDPSKTAITYGRAWAALGGLMPMLEQVFVIKRRNLNVVCDFSAPKTTVYARMQITLTVGRAIGLAVRYGIRALREFLKIKKSKGGAEV